jgi:hypothetical protein
MLFCLILLFGYIDDRRFAEYPTPFLVGFYCLGLLDELAKCIMDMAVGGFFCLCIENENEILHNYLSLGENLFLVKRVWLGK